MGISFLTEGPLVDDLAMVPVSTWISAGGTTGCFFEIFDDRLEDRMFFFTFFGVSLSFLFSFAFVSRLSVGIN